MRWRSELAMHTYDIIYHPGNVNVVADMVFRISAPSNNNNHKIIFELHQWLCDPGITWVLHFVRSRNLPYSVGDVRNFTSSYPLCAEIKPQYYKNDSSHLIKATSTFKPIEYRFHRTTANSSRNKYLLVIVDEYLLHIPVWVPSADTSSFQVLACLHIMCIRIEE